jgi:8-oxo-dGTP pyrophosphatase MutT (NUDIX family)
MCVEVKIDIENLAKKSAKRELEEETWVFLKEEDLKLFHISHAGSSVKWDLYYYLASISWLDNNEKEIKTEEWEDIKTWWYKRDEVIKMCLAWDIKEDRTLWILLKFLLSQK